jgi:cytochrome c oxidase subunit 2
MRRILTAIGVAAAFLAIAAATATIGASPDPQVIHLTVHRFAYNKTAIAVKKGTPVVIEIASLDVLHGFSLPDFGVRADVEPGKVARVTFTPDKAGDFTYLCDIFCGSGHENVHGILTVTD